MSVPSTAPSTLSSPRLSVAMSVYNNAPHLALAIESILSQTMADFEMLVVDDGSTDGSGAIIGHYVARDSRIRLWRQPNAGLIASLNRLVGEARSDVIARMDGDDIAEPTRFARQLAFLAAHPDYGVVGTWTNGIDAAGNWFPDHDGQPTDHATLMAQIEHGSVLCHPSVVMRTAVVRAVGGYHRAFRHCEDYDLWLRLSERTQLCSIPERLLRYRHSESQVSSRHALVQQVGRRIAWQCHLERVAGRPDPSLAWDELPAIADLDRVFGRSGVATSVRSDVAAGIVYSRSALAGDGFPLILDHLRAGGATTGLTRTVMRLVRFGMPGRAARLAAALVAR